MHNTAEFPLVPIQGAQLWPLSVAAYHVLGDAGIIPQNTELLYGFVYRKMAKSPLHSALVQRLIRLMTSALPPGFSLRSEQPITCADSKPEPDIAVVRGTEKDFWAAHPKTAELVIEVCVTSHEYDRSKLRAYASAGVKECWLILVPEQEVEVYLRSENGTFSEPSVVGPGGTLSARALPGFGLSLGSFFSR